MVTELFVDALNTRLGRIKVREGDNRSRQDVFDARLVCRPRLPCRSQRARCPYEPDAMFFFRVRRTHTRSHFADLRAPDVNAITMGNNLVAVDLKAHKLAHRVRLATDQGVAAHKVIFLGLQRNREAYPRFERIGLVAEIVASEDSDRPQCEPCPRLLSRKAVRP